MAYSSRASRDHLATGYRPQQLAGSPLYPGSAPGAAQQASFAYGSEDEEHQQQQQHHSGFHLPRSLSRSRSRSRSQIFFGDQGSTTPPPPAPTLDEPEQQHHNKHKKKHQIRTLRAEYKIARGVEVLLKEKKKGRLADEMGFGAGGGGGGGAGGVEEVVMGLAGRFEEQIRVSRSGGGRQRSVSVGRSNGGGGGGADLGGMAVGLLGMAEQAEQRYVSSRRRSQSQSSSYPAGAERGQGDNGGVLQMLEKDVASPQAAALLVGVVGAVSVKEPRRRSSTGGGAELSRQQSFSNFIHPSPSFDSTSPSPLHLRVNPRQHLAVRHAAATLLMKEPEMQYITGRRSDMVSLLERGESQAQGGGPTKALFGVPLSTLVLHESTDSHHGIAPNTTLRIPTFIDHCLTALMQMDVTVEGILRRSGNLHQLHSIMLALDNAGGNDTVIDLAAIDQITLASLLKKFLAKLPDPVLTEHLFDLFVATSHIKNMWIRKRAMHLVVCMMPKVNRDVMEVIFLFLDWLSTFAHITVKDGNQMELTSMAKVMAPTLMRPYGRDAKVEELPAMIAAVFNLLEDQHIYHEIPFELAHVLHMDLPRRDTRSLLKKMEDFFSGSSHRHQQH
ncbi:Rho GTPase activation protein [Leucosporidium creatinivorum]|uniref:Rho GTPase activation protein n=1 Tax=Leucosporidium creatinivorum TaxID=106004 RepID=A0A1Y2FZ22_9BASI|nr:Rho GTPase activation protein [Leucosporidium creatinivorum]